MQIESKYFEKYKVYLTKVIKENHDTYSFDFSFEEYIEWQEGDSVKLFIPVNDGIKGKKFSLATIQKEGYIKITTRIKENPSDYKKGLLKMNLGDEAEISFPSGQMALRREDRPIFVVSNGVGIAVTRSLVKAYEDNKESIPYMLSLNVNRESKIYGDEFMEFTRHSSFESIYANKRENFYRLLDSELQRMMTIKTPIIYAVGSDDFVNETISYLKSFGFSEDDFSLEGHIKRGEACTCGSKVICDCTTFFEPPKNSQHFNIIKAS